MNSKNPTKRTKTRDMHRLKRIKVLALDVDGVLTDGKFLLLGKRLVRSLAARDGLGLCLLHHGGIRTAVLSGKPLGPELKRRLRQLQVEEVRENVTDKVRVLQEFLVRVGAGWQEAGYMGDDLPDLPVIEKVGWAVSPADGCAEVKKAAHFLCRKAGGDGAVREAAEFLLRGSGRWTRAVKDYLRRLPDGC